MFKRLKLTRCLTVDTLTVALGVADGLQRDSFTLAAPPSLHKHKQTHIQSFISSHDYLDYKNKLFTSILRSMLTRAVLSESEVLLHI